MNRKICTSRGLEILVIAMLILASSTPALARLMGKGQYIYQEFPPVRPASPPAYHAPRAGDRLDEDWQFIQYLYDADSLYPGYWNAVPVGLGFTPKGRGFLATLHTVFNSMDGGISWDNIDPNPPPSTQSDFVVLRSPTYISNLAVRPRSRDTTRTDTVLITTVNGNLDMGTVRLIYNLMGYRLYPLAQYTTNYWLTNITIPDSVTAFAYAGMEGRLYGNDSLWLSQWEYLSSDKVLIRAGRQDSLDLNETWVSGAANAGSLIVAVGSHHWISRDGGRWWRIRPAADSIFDNCVSFSDTVHGLTGGGTISPQSQGWVHRTTNGGESWSGRVLQTDIPIRSVEMVSPQMAFAAGGNYEQAVGKIWSSTDGGATWNQDLLLGAEIKCLESRRVNAAYVDVFAAGAFPDFRGGVWRKRIFLPDTTGPVVMADPDSLNFGSLLPGTRDTLFVTLHNFGGAADSILEITGGTTEFIPLWTAEHVELRAGEELTLPVMFRSMTEGEFQCHLQVVTQTSGPVDIFCRAEVSISDINRPGVSLLPSDAKLSVWPNPGNSSFDIRFELQRAALASVRVFDLSGRLVATLVEASFAAGEYTRTWDGNSQASGIYFVRLDVAGMQGIAQKVLLLK